MSVRWDTTVPADLYKPRETLLPTVTEAEVVYPVVEKLYHNNRQLDVLNYSSKSRFERHWMYTNYSYIFIRGSIFDTNDNTTLSDVLTAFNGVEFFIPCDYEIINWDTPVAISLQEAFMLIPGNFHFIMITYVLNTAVIDRLTPYNVRNNGIQELYSTPERITKVIVDGIRNYGVSYVPMGGPVKMLLGNEVDPVEYHNPIVTAEEQTKNNERISLMGKPLVGEFVIPKPMLPYNNFMMNAQYMMKPQQQNVKGVVDPMTRIKPFVGLKEDPVIEPAYLTNIDNLTLTSFSL